MISIKRSIISISALLVLLGVTLYLNLNQKVSTEVGTKPGFVAPDFTLKDLDGNEISLHAQRGKPVFINIWASWCPPCKAEMPHIQAAYDRYKDQIQFIIIDSIEYDTMEDLETYLKEEGFTFPVYLDEDSIVFDQYHILGWPTSFFIDKDGIIVDKVTMPMSAEMLESYLRGLIED